MNCTDSKESHSGLSELIAKYHAIQALKIAEVNALGSSPRLRERGALKVPEKA